MEDVNKLASTIDNYRDVDIEEYNFEHVQIDLYQFEQLDAEDLIINIWCYNSRKKHFSKCAICQKYSSFSIAALKGKWEKEWGDFDYFIEQVKRNDRYYNIQKYTSADKQKIIDFIKKYNKKN